MKVTKRIVIIAVLMGVITVGALSFYINSLDQPAVAGAQEMHEVVVATTTIPAHTRITSEMLEVKSLPENAVHPDAVSAMDEVAGGVSMSLIASEEQVLSTKVVTDEEHASLSYRVPEGKRAIAVPADDISGVAGYISPEDKIDIIITYADEEIDEQTVTYTTFQNVMVLATGAVTQPKDEANQEGGTLVVAATPEQAEVLAYAYLKGTFHFTLRAPQDDGEERLDGYNAENFDTFRER